jgi:hypothetical protein
MTLAPPAALAPPSPSLAPHRSAASDGPAIHAGGWSLIAAALGFVAIFSYLAARFDYPAVLDGDASTVLPRLLSLGDAGRAVWAVYALVPLLLLPAAVGAYTALRQAAPGAMRSATLLATIAALSMTLGLARWPSIHWELARSYATADPASRTALDAVFAGLNLYLGNYIGEFIGELCLNGFFLLSGYAALRSQRLPRWLGYAGLVVGVVGVVAAFRNAATFVGPIAEVNNYILPLWMLVFGGALVRCRAQV